MRRHILIFDVHGCLAELDTLLGELHLRHDDKLIFGGDLLDKGPDSVGVVQRVRQLAEHYDVTLVLGNHEEKHARWRKHEARKELTGVSNPITHREVNIIGKQLTQKDVQFLDTAVLYYRIPTFDAFVVHAGIPTWCRFIPKTPSAINHMSSKQRKRYLEMCRLRYETPNGRFVMLGKETSQDRFWAETYDGRFGRVFYGHHAYMQSTPKEYEHAVGMDLGCVYGGHLVAAILTGVNSVEYIVVQAKQAYKSIQHSRN